MANFILLVIILCGLFMVLTGVHGMYEKGFRFFEFTTAEKFLCLSLLLALLILFPWLFIISILCIGIYRFAK